MEQFRQIGQVLGSIKALMVFRDNIQINQRQCCLLLDLFSFAYDSIAEEMRQNLKFEEKHSKWRVLEQPLRAVDKIFKEGEAYIRQCLDTKDWWAKAITLYQNTDCIQFHIHNLFGCIPTVVEAIELAGESSGWDHDEIQKKKLVYSKKYKEEWKDPKLFEWKFGKQYLITNDFCSRLETVWKEDRWILLNKLREKKNSTMTSTRYEQCLTDLLFKNLDGSDAVNGTLFPSSFLLCSTDYQVKRRLGSGSQYKEIQWLGESFALRHFFGHIEPLIPYISSLLSLSHPNIMHFFCGFTDEEKKECFLVMELMNGNLCSYIKEICGPRKRIPFSLPLAVDLMLQIARGMEYLHSKKIYHGDLNPSNILVKARRVSTEVYLHAKVSGFGLTAYNKFTKKSSSNQIQTNPFIWCAPEVLEEQEQTASSGNSKYTEKADVYSFGMVCFELLTGKVPFEDSHLQGDKMSRNIRAGERPLFPFHSLKYVTNLTKRCWNTDPNQRPSFSSICRILRHIKRFLTMNPDYMLDSPMTLVDYCDIESTLLRKFPSWGSSDPSLISHIPFEMFAYRVVEKDKTSGGSKDNSESGSDKSSTCEDENVTTADEPVTPATERRFSASPDSTPKKIASLKKFAEVKANKQPGTPKGRAIRPPQISLCRRSMRLSSESHMLLTSPKIRRTKSGHASDSELP